MNCKNKSFMSKKKAFTLIELLIVIAIIGILFIVLVSKVDFATDKAKATGVQTDFRSFQMAFDTVAKENAGFNTFGWDTGDANQDGIRNSYDEGDNGAGGGIAQNGIQDGTEVFTGHKVYAETFTKVYSLKKNGTGSYDREALNRLETAINANLDPKLHITIKDDGEIVMANGARDPWNKEYHGAYITNAEVDGKDRGAIVMYSDGANNEFGSAHTIANGVVSVTIPNSNKDGKDDYSIVSVYTYVNGYGEVLNITTGFSNNQNLLANGNAPTLVPGGGTNDDNEPSPGPGGYQMLAAPSNITVSAGTIFRSEADINLFKEVRIDGNIVPQTAYSVRSGSTIVTFFGEYLDSLSNGEHEMEIVALNGGSAKSTFSVNISCRNHIDEDWDQYCDTCNIVYCYETVCKNENDDCFCDYCGWTSYEGEIWQPPDRGEFWHVDANQDSYCDKCNGIYCCDGGPCIDLDGDCICESCCWEQYWDKNLDGYCDGCGVVYCYDSKIHHDDNKDGRCDFCFEIMCNLYDHVDDDYDGCCDICEMVVGCSLGGMCRGETPYSESCVGCGLNPWRNHVCVDAEEDHDHWCDLCEAWTQSCIAEPGNRCSICGEYPCYWEVCIDNNGDDHCDYCGEFDCRWNGCVAGDDCRCEGCGTFRHIDNNEDGICDTCFDAVDY